MEKIIKVFKSHKEADEADKEYWRNASYETRIETMFFIQQLMLELYYPDVKRMEKVISKRKFGD